MAAVAEAPEVAADQIISQPTRLVHFASYAAELRLVYAPEYPIFGPHGQRTGQMSDGVRIAFKDGMLRVPADGHVRTEQGRKFEAVKLLAWLREHPLLNDRSNGFWEIPIGAPGISDAEIQAVMGAAFDYERLQELLGAEEKGWGRPGLLTPLRAHIKRLDDLQAQVEEQEAQRVAEEAAAAAKPAAKAKAQPAAKA